MGLRPNEISALIKEQIKHYDDIIEQKDVGTVVTVGDGVSVIHGLDNAMLGELLLFPNDVYGMVMNLDEDSVGTKRFWWISCTRKKLLWERISVLATREAAQPKC